MSDERDAKLNEKFPDYGTIAAGLGLLLPRLFLLLILLYC